MAMELGTPGQYPALRGQGLVSVRHPSRLCFARIQAVTVLKQSVRAKEAPGEGGCGKDIVQALKKLAAANAGFISRGDKSGTHAAELRFWKAAELADGKGSGYKECGCGMGPALNMAAGSNAYVMADRGTWLNFKNRGDLAVLVEGDKRLFNQYGVILINPAKHPHVKVADAQKFIDWVISAPGQSAIAQYRIGGEQLFFPNAGDDQ